MHGLIVLGFNGAVVFHTSPLTRAVVDHIVEIVQSDLHMTVASHYYATAVAANGGNMGGGGSAAAGRVSAADGASSHHQYVATSAANLGGASGRHTMAPGMSSRSGASESNRGGGGVYAAVSGGNTAGAGSSLRDTTNFTRSHTNAMYRATMAIDRSGGADTSNTIGSPPIPATRARGGSAFHAKEENSLAANGKKKRFKFMSRFDSSGSPSGSGGLGGGLSLGGAPSGGGTSSSPSGSSNAHGYFISDAAYATSHCMARNVKGVCDGTIAVSPSEHAWLRHHIASFVAIGEPRREEADEDLIASDPEAVARVGIIGGGGVAGTNTTASGAVTDILRAGVGNTTNNTNAAGTTMIGVSTGGGGFGGGGRANGGNTHSSGAVFTRGVNVVAAQTGANGLLMGNNAGDSLSGGNQNGNNNKLGGGGGPAVTQTATTTAAGGVVLDPTVAATELFVLLYWRKVGDRIFIMVLHEDDSIALAKHLLSTFVALLCDAFRLYAADADVGVVGSVGGGSGAAAAGGYSYAGMQYAGAAGGGAATLNGLGTASTTEAHRLFGQVDRMMREDTALAQLPSLRAMLMRPDVVQRCLDIVAPQNVMVMMDLPIARVCLQRQMKAK